MRPLAPLVLFALAAPIAALQCDSTAGGTGFSGGGGGAGFIPGAPTTPWTPPNGAPVTAGSGGFILTSSGLLDDSHWSVWWALHRDHFLDLREHVRSNGPTTGLNAYAVGDAALPRLEVTPKRVQQQVLPLLFETLEQDPSTSVVKSTLLALAKTAGGLDDVAKAEAANRIGAFLDDASQPMAEAALVALGLLGHDAEAPRLASVVDDSETGRSLVGKRSSIPERRRAFGAYGLGLLGSQSTREDVRRFAAHHLMQALDDVSLQHEFELACVLALGWIPLEGETHPPEDDSSTSPSATRAGALEFLHGILLDSNRHRLVRGASARSMAALLADLDQLTRSEWKARIAPDLLNVLDPRGKGDRELVGACILALGELGDADEDELDQSIRDGLERVAETSSDPFARGASQVALARVGARSGGGVLPSPASVQIERHLLDTIARGRATERPWAALGLGILGQALHRQRIPLEEETDTILRSAIVSASSPDEEAAYALALGLRRDPRAVPLLIERVESRDVFLAGRAAVALGLAGDSRALAPLRLVVEESLTKPNLTLAASEGLALLGDESIVASLTVQLERAGGMSPQAGAASCLGRLGDPRALDALVGAVRRPTVGDLTRSVALDALGQTVQPRLIPWQAFATLALSVQSAPASLFDAAGTGLLGLP